MGALANYVEYSTRKGLSKDYLEHLRHSEVRAGHMGIARTVAQANMNLIASDERLAEMGIKATQSAANQVSSQIQSSADQVSSSIDSMSMELNFAIGATTDAINDMHSTLGYGFAAMEAGLGALAVAIKELIEIAKTPSQTWAFEQFAIARDAVRKGLHPEAMEAVDRALNGHGDHVGNKLDYRTHMLKGFIHLGDVQNLYPELVDPALAKESFMLSYRYAKIDDPIEAGRALAAAGWCEYVSGNLKEALSLTSDAVSLLQLKFDELHSMRNKYAYLSWRVRDAYSKTETKLSDALYQESKIQISLGDKAASTIALEKSVSLDGMMGIRASSDSAYEGNADVVATALKNARNNLKTELVNLAINKDERIEAVKKFSEQISGINEEITSFAEDITQLSGRTKTFNPVAIKEEAITCVNLVSSQSSDIEVADNIADLQYIKKKLVKNVDIENTLSRALSIAEESLEKAEDARLKAQKEAEKEAEVARLKAQKEAEKEAGVARLKAQKEAEVARRMIEDEGTITGSLVKMSLFVGLILGFLISTVVKGIFPHAQPEMPLFVGSTIIVLFYLLSRRRQRINALQRKINAAQQIILENS